MFPLSSVNKKLIAKDILAHGLPVFDGWTQEEIASFGRKPFIIRHSLAYSRLFELPNLERLANVIYSARISGRAIDARLKARKNREDCRGAGGMSSWDDKIDVTFSKGGWKDELAALFENLERNHSGLSVMLSFANEVDDEYGDIMRQTVREAADAAGIARSAITFAGMTIIVSAPGAVTPFHNDHDQNFLIQIRGGKDVFLYDQTDAFILPQIAMEEFHIGDAGAMRYRPEFKGLETLYHLEPGLAVHHPPLAPHWVRTGDNVSVSASIFFSTQAMDDLSRAHQANWLLRRVGFKPPLPDLDRRTDRLKAAVLGRVSGERDSYEALFRGVRRLKSPARNLREAWKSARSRGGGQKAAA